MSFVVMTVVPRRLIASTTSLTAFSLPGIARVAENTTVSPEWSCTCW